MSITTSVIIRAIVQGDGRYSVDELHTDHLGKQYPRSYLADAGLDRSAILSAYAIWLANDLADREFERLIGTLELGFSLSHQTAAQFGARYRERYRTSTALECGYLATWILNHIDAGDFTDTQVRNAFGLTTNQYTTLKAKMTTLRTNYLAVLASAGE